MPFLLLVALWICCILLGIYVFVRFMVKDRTGAAAIGYILLAMGVPVAVELLTGSQNGKAAWQLILHPIVTVKGLLPPGPLRTWTRMTWVAFCFGLWVALPILGGILQGTYFLFRWLAGLLSRAGRAVQLAPWVLLVTGLILVIPYIGSALSESEEQIPGSLFELNRAVIEFIYELNWWKILQHPIANVRSIEAHLPVLAAAHTPSDSTPGWPWQSWVGYTQSAFIGYVLILSTAFLALGLAILNQVAKWLAPPAKPEASRPQPPAARQAQSSSSTSKAKQMVPSEVQPTPAPPEASETTAPPAPVPHPPPSPPPAPKPKPKPKVDPIKRQWKALADKLKGLPETEAMAMVSYEDINQTSQSDKTKTIQLIGCPDGKSVELIVDRETEKVLSAKVK